jgi:hypothetical protein
MKKIWGPITWTLLHVMADRINDEDYEHINGCVNTIISICGNLPCVLCSDSISNIISRYKIKLIRSKKDLIDFVFTIHNEVNKKLKKTIYDKDILIKYSRNNFTEVLNVFFRTYNNRTYNRNLLLHSFRKNIMLDNIRKYFINNRKLYNI